MNRILILSVTAGQGHNSTARAVSDCLRERGMETKILDTGYFYSNLIGKTIDDGYLLSVNNLKDIYRKVYAKLEHRKSSRMSPVRMTNNLLWRKLHRFIEEYDPDVVISTHVFTAMILDAMQRVKPIRAKTIGIVTDFEFHPFWEETLLLDRVVVASELMIALGRNKGFREEQVMPTGIPINPKFNTKHSRAEACAMMGLDDTRRTVLVMAGSMGYGNIVKTVQSLDECPSSFQIAVVCGNNEESKKSLDSLTTKKKLVTFGFTDQVDVLMDASDIIVTKPGGLTSSEALAKGLPMVIVNPIPGQEDRNAQYLLNFGVAVQANDMFTVDILVESIMSDPTRLNAMQQSAHRLGKPNATCDLCDLIESFITRS